MLSSRDSIIGTNLISALLEEIKGFELASNYMLGSLPQHT